MTTRTSVRNAGPLPRPRNLPGSAWGAAPARLPGADWRLRAAQRAGDRVPVPRGLPLVGGLLGYGEDSEGRPGSTGALANLQPGPVLTRPQARTWARARGPGSSRPLCGGPPVSTPPWAHCPPEPSPRCLDVTAPLLTQKHARAAGSGAPEWGGGLCGSRERPPAHGGGRGRLCSAGDRGVRGGSTAQRGRAAWTRPGRARVT